MLTLWRLQSRSKEVVFMKEYISLKIKVVEVLEEDVITSSPTTESDDLPWEGWYEG